ncbi:hypothetical protein [uncultured Acinetobacter sp.]|uniref:hypothetical protein n=1 Tax=uncultured Acinetobacter sp. TaxID=165433 RepID=UPI0025888F2B|nr:hypothetical protein [uncultured Acinetobacter sp.]
MSILIFITIIFTNDKTKEIILNKIIFIFSLLCSSGCFAINPDQEYMMFLKKYEQLSNVMNLDGLEMYADDAKVHSKEISADGIERTMSMSGKKLKELVNQNIDILRNMAYQTNFSNVKIIRNIDSAKILATKYSNKDCYSDADYYMVVSRKADKKLYITEEYFTVSPKNLCEKGIKDDLALQLSLGANMMKNKLPMKVDRETSLEDVIAKDKQLTFIYRLIHFTSNDLPSNWIEVNGVPQIIKGVCADTKMKDLLDKGGEINLKYYYSDNTEATKIKLNRNDCSI